MPSERMTFWQRRMVEIFSRIAVHPKPFHDCSRAVVGRRCERYDLRERERPKPVAQRQAASLRCITASPMLEGQTPADFHTGREMGTESCDCQSGETHKRRYIRDLDSPKAKAMVAEMLPDAIDHRVALNSTEATPEEFHNSRIGIHCGKRFTILVTPFTQADAAAGQCRKCAHRCMILSKKCSGESVAGRAPRRRESLVEEGSTRRVVGPARRRSPALYRGASSRQRAKRINVLRLLSGNDPPR